MLIRRSSLWRNASPRGAVADLIAEWRKPTPYRWPILGASIALTAGLFLIMLPESERALPRKPKVTWFTTFAPDRTDYEIVQSNVENQKVQDKLEAERAARAERRRQMFRAIGRASGFDVDKLEKEFSGPAPDDTMPVPAAPPAPQQREPPRIHGGWPPPPALTNAPVR